MRACTIITAISPLLAAAGSTAGQMYRLWVDVVIAYESRPAPARARIVHRETGYRRRPTTLRGPYATICFTVVC